MLKALRLIKFLIFMYQGVVVSRNNNHFNKLYTHLHTSHKFEFYITKLRRVD